MKNVILGVVGTILIVTIAIVGFWSWRGGQEKVGVSSPDEYSTSQISIEDDTLTILDHSNTNNTCEDKNKVYFSIPELGIKVLVNKNIKDDLIYEIDNSVASFTTKKLVSIGGIGCSLQNGASPLGNIKIIQGVPQAGWKGELGTAVFVKQLKDSFIAFTPAGIPCCDLSNKECARYDVNIFRLLEQQDKECVKEFAKSVSIEKENNNQGITDNLNWPTYTSEKFEISFRYPKKWYITEEDKRIYISNTPNDIDKGTMSSNFQQVWISIWDEEIKDAKKEMKTSPKTFKKLIASEIIDKNNFIINTHEYQGEGGPRLEASWRNKLGKEYFATNSTEVGSKNQKSMITNLKLILSTTKFIK
jgi:hypothetical protein